MGSRVYSYHKNAYLLLEGDFVQTVGLIIHGTILMEKNDPWGNHYFFTELKDDELFMEPFMGSVSQASSVNYKAVTDCSVLFFHYRSMWQPCSKNCRCHSIFTENLMNLLACKTRSMMAKVEILSRKSLRDRILTFLYIIKTQRDIVGFHSRCSNADAEDEGIYVPLNRTEMADYLNVNRSALIRELSRMQEEHILRIEKNSFYLLD